MATIILRLSVNIIWKLGAISVLAAINFVWMEFENWVTGEQSGSTMWGTMIDLLNEYCDFFFVKNEHSGPLEASSQGNFLCVFISGAYRSAASTFQ